jgi:hypothetical protein
MRKTLLTCLLSSVFLVACSSSNDTSGQDNTDKATSAPTTTAEVVNPAQIESAQHAQEFPNVNSNPTADDYANAGNTTNAAPPSTVSDADASLPAMDNVVVAPSPSAPATPINTAPAPENVTTMPATTDNTMSAPANTMPQSTVATPAPANNTTMPAPSSNNTTGGTPLVAPTSTSSMSIGTSEAATAAATTTSAPGTPLVAPASGNASAATMPTPSTSTPAQTPAATTNQPASNLDEMATPVTFGTAASTGQNADTDNAAATSSAPAVSTSTNTAPSSAPTGN